MTVIKKRTVWRLKSGSTISVTDVQIKHMKNIYKYLKDIEVDCKENKVPFPKVKASRIAKACKIHISKIIGLLLLMAERDDKPAVIRLVAHHFISDTHKYTTFHYVELVDLNR